MSEFIGNRSRTAFNQAPNLGELPAVILRVQVVGCADLLASDTSGKSDPCVAVRLGGDKRKTPYIKQCLNPEYPPDQATFDFNIYRSNMGYLGALECVVWDWDPIRNDYLGEVAIPSDEWFKRHEPSSALAFDDPLNTAFSATLTSTRKNIPVKGTIQLKIGFVSVDLTSPSYYAAIFTELQHAVKIGGSTLHSSAKSPLTNIHESDINSSPNNDIVGIVMLEIQGAEGLPRWKNAFRVGMDMDPFCVISFGKKSFSTRVVRHSLNPDWNQKLLLHVHQQETDLEIQFTVFDFDKISRSDEIGRASLGLQSLMAKVPRPDSEKMTPPGTVTSEEQYTTDHRLPVVPDNSSLQENEAMPTLKFRANYQPNHALLQKLWRRCLDSHDTSGNRRISRSELESLLRELGSTLSKKTIDDFFIRFKVSPKKGDLTMDQVITCLQEKSMEQRGEGSSFNDVVERVIDINLQNCPVCRQPRAKGETDLIVHLAVCLSPDWAGAEWMVGDAHAGSRGKRKATSSPHGSL